MAGMILFALGVIIGWSLGFLAGRSESSFKPWSELTEKEKRIRMTLIFVAVIMLILGIVGAFLAY